MKTKILILVITGGLTASSCNKTYECKNQAGIIIGEVKARSQSKANSLCQASSPDPITANRK